MKKKYLIAIVACLGMITSNAQTLFTYGSYAADAKDFLRAYNKNNTQPVVNKAKSISDYLDLYIKSRLKIREAYDRRYDTLQQITTEVDNLRTQIAENYLTDPEIGQRLFNQSFQRSLKDIHVAHIFVSFKNAAGLTDTLAAGKKRDDILLEFMISYSKPSEENKSSDRVPCALGRFPERIREKTEGCSIRISIVR